MGSNGSHDPWGLTYIQAFPCIHGMTEPVRADGCLHFYTLIRNIPMPFPDWSWCGGNMGKTFWLSESSLPNLLPSCLHQKQVQLRGRCPQEPYSVAFLWLSGSLWKTLMSGWCASRFAHSLASIPSLPLTPYWGHFFFCFPCKHIFIECLLCAGDCFQLLVYISGRDKHLLLRGTYMLGYLFY